MPAIKDSNRLRNVLFHIVQSPADIKAAETPLFDVFICLDARDTAGDISDTYLIEQIGQFAVMTKRAEYQETQTAESLN